MRALLCRRDGVEQVADRDAERPRKADERERSRVGRPSLDAADVIEAQMSELRETVLRELALEAQAPNLRAQLSENRRPLPTRRRVRFPPWHANVLYSIGVPG